jgi:hypothetical protein
MSKASDKLRHFPLGPHADDRDAAGAVLALAATLMDSCVDRVPGARLGTVKCAHWLD